MDDIVNDFLIESHEGLDQLDRDLVALEHAPTDRELLARIFRCIHTVKGTCGFLGFSKLESVSHVGENLLVRLRDGELVVSASLTSALLALVDAIRQILASIEATREEGDVDYADLIATLTALSEGVEAPTSSAAVPMTEVSPATATAPITPTASPKARKGTKPDSKPPEYPVLASNTVGAILVLSGLAEQADVIAALQEQSAGDSRRLGEILVERAVVPPMAIVDALEAQAEGRTSISESTIRVEVALLDRLMNLVGELVLARNQILQHAATAEGTLLAVPAQRLNLLTTELQEGVMKTRMQPIGNIWSRFPRIVRDLAVACNKQIRLEMEGKETELDKTIIEAIKDPLTHIVRNAADHGIELPAARKALGKPAEGVLALRAYHEGGQVIIEVSDDGAGIDAERVKQKAVQKGLISADQATRLSEREVLNLVFLPGLSTAQQVTNISGRGVGMDVVKSNIEKIGGAVDIYSKLGEGSTLKIRIPLTLAIIPALIVASSGNRYAIPQASLVELVRREERDGGGGHGIEMIHGAPVYRLRGNLLPLVYARTALESTSGVAARDDALNIVVLQADDRTFGLVVDDIYETEEIVVKPLGERLKGIAVFAGATIRGDGRVALIIDVMGLAQHSHVISEVRGRNHAEHVAHVRTGIANRQTLLVCGLGGTRRAAILLSSIARLEEFPAESIEHAGHYDVVQYRDQIMPLLDLPTLLGFSNGDERSGKLQVVVYSENDRNVGFVVARILDIVEDEVRLDVTTTREGMLGSIIVQQKVTDVLDMAAIVRHAAPWLLGGDKSQEHAA